MGGAETVLVAMIKVMLKIASTTPKWAIEDGAIICVVMAAWLLLMMVVMITMAMSDECRTMSRVMGDDDDAEDDDDVADDDE